MSLQPYYRSMDMIVLFPAFLEVAVVCICVKSSFHASLLNIPDFNFSESLWCSVMVCGSDTLIVGVIFHSPSSSPENNSSMLKLLAEVQKLAT